MKLGGLISFAATDENKNSPPSKLVGGNLERHYMSSVRKIVDQLLGRRVPLLKLSVIGRILNDPDWSESKTEPLLCNLSEAARRLGCSRSRFWQLRKQGIIPTVMLEGVRYVRSQDLDDIVRELQQSEVTA